MVCILCYSTTTFAFDPISDAKKGIPCEYTPAEGSVEELYKDMIVTLLEPIIYDEIKNYYGQDLQSDLFDIDFLNIDRPDYRSFTFIVKLRVKPFYGPHNHVGIDEITISIQPEEIKIEEFKHIKTFSLPPKDNLCS